MPSGLIKSIEIINTSIDFNEIFAGKIQSFKSTQSHESIQDLSHDEFPTELNALFYQDHFFWAALIANKNIAAAKAKADEEFASAEASLIDAIRVSKEASAAAAATCSYEFRRKEVDASPEVLRDLLSISADLDRAAHEARVKVDSAREFFLAIRLERKEIEAKKSANLRSILTSL